MFVKKWYQTVIIISILIWISGCTNRPQIVDEETTRTITDSTLTTAIKSEFKSHPYISTGDIRVKSEDGIVTLFGTAGNLFEKEKARDLARMIRGVRSVINLIEVKPVQIPNDSILKQEIDEAFYKDPVMEAFQLIVKVDSGIVNLHGRVDSWHEKQLAGEIVKKIKGIRKVNNNIAFVYKTERPAMDIRADIISLLRNDVRINDGLINVNLRGDTAVLSGTVGSAAEKSLAVVHAWVDGIDTVISKDLHVSAEVQNPMMRKDKYIKKSDPQIIRAIQLTFLQDPRLLNHHIKVESKNGHVTLMGSVNNLRAKKAASEDVNNVVGVWKADNQIKVEPVLMPTPKTLADVVKTAIGRHPLLDGYNITIENDDRGNITLHGKVKYNFEKQQAEDVVSDVPGIVNITNNIEVTEGIELPYRISSETRDYPTIKKPNLKNDAQIKRDVAYQLWWSPFVDRNQIKIDVKNGVVTLNGTVNTRLEMDYAVKNAYEGGAFTVINNLKVDFWEI